MNDINQISNGKSNPGDDLKKIKGVGQSIEKALNDLGISRFSDLAKLTPEELVRLLKPKVAFVSIHRIESNDWIGQAQELAREEIGRVSFQPDTNESILSEVEISDDVGKEPPAPSHPVAWQELADFFVSFGLNISPEGEEQIQTKIHHSQADKSAQWDGFAIDQLVEWMVDQANLTPSIRTESPDKYISTSELSLAKEPEEGQPDAQIYVTDLWVSEARIPITMSGQGSPPRLKAVSKLIIEGSAALELTRDETPFTVEYFLVDTQTHKTELVATRRERLVPDTLTYDIEQDFPIPQPGRHQLYVVARLSPPAILATHVQGPVIRVEL